MTLQRTVRAMAAALVVLVLAAACSGDADETQAGAEQDGETPSAAAPEALTTPEPAETELETIPLPGGTEGTLQPLPEEPQTQATSAPDRSVTITSPVDGETVADPVSLEVTVDGFVLEEIDGSVEPDRGHLYAYIDRQLPASQERIPEDPDIVRFWESPVELPPMGPGEHTIRVIASHGYPVPMMPITSDEVTVTVR